MSGAVRAMMISAGRGGGRQSPGSALGVASACALGNVFGMSTLIFSTFPMFFVPVTTSLGWSPAQFSFTLTIIAVVDFFAYPVGGLLMDRFGARPIILTGNVLLGLSIMALGTLGPDMAYSYALFAVVGVCAALPSTVLLSRVISSWFQDHRGMALAIASGLAFGVGAAVNPLVAGAVIGHLGWRSAYVVLGALPILVVNPVMIVLLWQPATPPTDSAAAGASTIGKDDPDVADTSVPLSVAARTRQFWLLLVPAALAPATVVAITSHAVVLLAANGLGVGAAAAAISASAIASAVWQLGLGRLLDRTGNPRLAGPFLIVAAIGALTIFGATSPWQAVLGGILLGVGAGTEYALLPYAVSFYFGLRDYGLIYGSLFGAVSLAIGLSALAMDFAFAWTGSYLAPSYGCATILLLCATLLFFLPDFASTRSGRSSLAA
ncbi:MAG: MFS transporter [Sphingomonas taxi]